MPSLTQDRVRAEALQFHDGRPGRKRTEVHAPFQVTIVIRALVIVTVHAVITRGRLIEAPQLTVDHLAGVVDRGVGEVAEIGHPLVGDPHVQLAQLLVLAHIG